jgi:hypothetical protein
VILTAVPPRKALTIVEREVGRRDDVDNRRPIRRKCCVDLGVHDEPVADWVS